MVWIPQIADLADRLAAPRLADALRRPAAAAVPVTLDDPVAGRVTGGAALGAWQDEQRRWRAERRVSVAPVSATVAPDRAVGEWVLTLDGPRGDRTGLPVAAVVEPAADLPVRVYHSQWPLLGHHAVRPPLLPVARVHASDVVGEYLDALAAGDTDRMVATFAPDGSIREPAGDAFRHTGTAALTDLYKRFFSAGGGVRLRHCTVTEDGVRSALEYVCDRWGDTDLPPQAGVAVYTRGPDGRIASAHVYDDVEGPVA